MTTYSDKLKDPRWQRKRLLVFKRDNWTCQKCGSKEDSLTVHHICYVPGADPWDHPDELLLTLCEFCHVKEKTILPSRKFQLITWAVLLSLKKDAEDHLAVRYSKKKSRYLDCIVF